MPELPEVETIARTLAPQVEGRRIVACELLNPSTFEGTIPVSYTHLKMPNKNLV